MAGALRRLYKKLPEQRIATHLNRPNPTDFIPPSILHLTKFPDKEPNRPTKLEIPIKAAFPIYPSFSFGYFLQPSGATYLGRSDGTEAQYEEDDGPVTMWADSVKRKRKRKMNKHKLRKRRKRLRQQKKRLRG